MKTNIFLVSMPEPGVTPHDHDVDMRWHLFVTKTSGMKPTPEHIAKNLQKPVHNCWVFPAIEGCTFLAKLVSSADEFRLPYTVFQTDGEVTNLSKAT